MFHECDCHPWVVGGHLKHELSMDNYGASEDIIQNSNHDDILDKRNLKR